MKEDTKHLCLGLLVILGIPLLLVLAIASLPLWAAVLVLVILLK